MLVTRKGMSLRFEASDEALRPTGRTTSGVRGIKLRSGDELLTMEVVVDDADFVVVTEGGYAKRTPLSEYRVQGRGGLGIKVANVREDRGALVGALVTSGDEELLAAVKHRRQRWHFEVHRHVGRAEGGQHILEVLLAQ